VEVLRRRGFTEEGKVHGGALSGSFRPMWGEREGGEGVELTWHCVEGKGSSGARGAEENGARRSTDSSTIAAGMDNARCT
jgi:hypothetical protein